MVCIQVYDTDVYQLHRSRQVYFRDFCDLDGRNVEHLSDICISVDWPSVVVQVHLMVMFGVSTQTYPSNAHFAPERVGLKDNGFFRDGFLAHVTLGSGSEQCIYNMYIMIWYKYVSMWPKCSWVMYERNVCVRGDWFYLWLFVDIISVYIYIHICSFVSIQIHIPFTYLYILYIYIYTYKYTVSPSFPVFFRCEKFANLSASGVCRFAIFGLSGKRQTPFVKKWSNPWRCDTSRMWKKKLWKSAISRDRF